MKLAIEVQNISTMEEAMILVARVMADIYTSPAVEDDGDLAHEEHGSFIYAAGMAAGHARWKIEA